MLVCAGRAPLFSQHPFYFLEQVCDVMAVCVCEAMLMENFTACSVFMYAQNGARE